MPKGALEREKQAWKKCLSSVAQLQSKFGQTVLLSYITRHGLVSYGGKNAVKKMNEAIVSVNVCAVRRESPG